MAVRFDASNDYLTKTGLSINLDSTTITFWAKLKVDRDAYSCPLSLFYNTGNYDGIYPEAVTTTEVPGGDTGKEFGLYLSDGTYEFVDPSYTMVVDRWFFVAISTTSGGVSTVRLLESGDTSFGWSATSTAQAFGNNANTLDVGSDLANEWFNGEVAALKIWSGAALSEAQLLQERQFRNPVNEAASCIGAFHFKSGALRVDSDGGIGDLTSGGGTETFVADPSDILGDSTPTEVVRYVNTAADGTGDGTTNGETGTSGAYASLSAWEAGEDTDLVAASQNHVVKCSTGSGTDADTTQCYIAGWTTSPTYNITIEPNTGHEAQSPYSTSIYRLEVSQGWSGCIKINTAHSVNVKNLQIKNTYTGGASQPMGIWVETPVGTQTHVFDGNVIYGSDTTWEGAFAAGILVDGNGDNLDVVIINNIVKQFYAGIYKGTYTGSSAATWLIANNTIIDCGEASLYLDNFDGDFSSTVFVYNNLCQGSGTTTHYLNPYGTFTTAGNITQDATSPQTALRSITLSFAGAGDYHLDSTDTEAIDAGTDLSSFTNYPFDWDIDGDTRSGWCIGADEYVSAGVTGTGDIDALIASLSAAGLPTLLDVTGTAVPDATEQELVTGGQTIVLTLKGGETWVPS